MKINGIYYTEPELMAKFRQMQVTIDRYEAENRKLTEEKEELGRLYNDASLGIGYLEQRCEELEKREKEYKRLLLLACADIHFIAETFHEECWVMHGAEYIFGIEENHTKWAHEAEALELIGEAND